MVKTIVKQGFGFILISGIGWLIDFSVYLLLTHVAGLPVGVSNFLSAIPSITFVFLVSTRKTFAQKQSRVKLWQKYLIYFGYQMVLLLCVSALSQFIYDQSMQGSLAQSAFWVSYCRVIIKLLITPITLTMNFFVMKNLIEKL